MFVVSINALSQTTIIVRMEKEKIIAVAETKITFIDGKKPDTMCKIGNCKNVWFAVGGLFVAQTKQQIMDCSKKTDNPKAIIDSFIDLRYNTLRNLLPWLRINYRTTYSSYLTVFYTVGAVFCYFENNK